MERKDIKDRRILTLAAEVAETRDRKLPDILLGIKDILDSCGADIRESARVRQEVWDYDLLRVLILVLKQDYSLVDGEWTTASKLATVLSQVCSGLVLPDEPEFESKHLPEAANNMLLLCRRIQSFFTQIPVIDSTHKLRGVLLDNLQSVLDDIAYLTRGQQFLTVYVLQSLWLLKMLISDDVETVVLIINLIQNILRINSFPDDISSPQHQFNFKLDFCFEILKIEKQQKYKFEESVFAEIKDAAAFNIMDELIYKLSVCYDAKIGEATMKCVLRICEYHRPMVEILCTRYKGLRLLVSKWTGRGFGKDLHQLIMLLDAGTSQRAEMERFHRAATTVQSLWRSFSTRRKLRKANAAFTKFQRSFRDRQMFTRNKKEREKIEAELRHMLLINRKQIMIEFNEKKYQALEIVPAAKINEYLQKEVLTAAIKIQKTWRGHAVRLQRGHRKTVVQQVKAAVKIQRMVRTWLARLERRRKEIRQFQKPPGLTDDRRVELQQAIVEHRELHPTKLKTREELEALHQKSAEILGLYYATSRQTRRNHQRREALLARLETDSEFLLYAPSLQDATEKDVDMFSSRSVPVATKARLAHTEHLKRLRQSWWQKLNDENQDLDKDDADFVFF